MPVSPRIAADAVEWIGATPDELRLIATWAIISCVGVFVIVWWLIGRVDDGCAQCAHCADRRATRQGKTNEDKTRERLFGSHVAGWESDDSEPPSEEPSGDSVLDEGLASPGEERV